MYWTCLLVQEIDIEKKHRISLRCVLEKKLEQRIINMYVYAVWIGLYSRSFIQVKGDGKITITAIILMQYTYHDGEVFFSFSSTTRFSFFQYYFSLHIENMYMDKIMYICMYSTYIVILCVLGLVIYSVYLQMLKQFVWMVRQKKKEKHRSSSL